MKYTKFKQSLGLSTNSISELPTMI